MYSEVGRWGAWLHCVCMFLNVYMCMSLGVYVCVCVNEAVWAYEHMCLCMAACQAVPSGCLTELLSLTGEVNCCGSAQAVSNTTLGTRRQQTIYMLVCVHAPTRARLCLKHKTRSGKPPAFFPPQHKKVKANPLYYMWTPSCEESLKEDLCPFFACQVT